MSLDTFNKSEEQYDIIGFRGEISIITSTPVSLELNKKVGKDFQKDLVLDLSEVNSIDSSGLRLIIGLNNTMSERNKQLYILKPSETVQKIFRETNMVKILKIIGSCETIEE